MTIGGNVLDCNGINKTSSADFIKIKILLNSPLSTFHAKHIAADVKNIYLETETKHK